MTVKYNRDCSAKSPDFVAIPTINKHKKTTKLKISFSQGMKSSGFAQHPEQRSNELITVFFFVIMKMKPNQ
jgi:hypothetical protein